MLVRVFGLDFIRALAIWGVMLSHGKHLLVGDAPGNVVFSVGGTLGVEAFFVLSGFLIGGILLRELGRALPSHHAATGFLLRRWFRTLPMYYAALALEVTYGLVFRGAATGFTWLHLVFLQNAAGPATFLDVSWSLTIEEWFYFLAAGTLLLVGFRGSGRRLALIALILIATSTAGRWYLAINGEGWEMTRRLLWFHFDGIAIGVLLAYVQRRYPEHWKRHATASAYVGMALLGAVIGSLAALRAAPQLDPGMWDWYQVHWFQAAAISVALIVPAIMRWQVQPGRMGAGITHISLVSYSMYLVHMPIQTVLERLGVFDPLPVGVAWSLWAVVTVAASTLTYKLIEVPFLQLRDKPNMPWSRLTRPQAGMARPTVAA